MIASTNHGRILHEGTGTGQIYYMRIAGFKQKKNIFQPAAKSVRKIASILKSLACKMQWGRAAVGMDADFFLQNAE